VIFYAVAQPDQSQSTKITVLGVKLDRHEESLVRLSKQFERFEQQMTEHLLHPEKGLYSRVSVAGNATSTVIRDAESIRIVIDGIAESTKQHERLLMKIEEWITDHEERDQSLRESVSQLITSVTPLKEDLARRASRQPWINKVIWLVVALIMTTFLTQIGSFVMSIRDIVNTQRDVDSE
jgi:iron-sulfur cluster repair protein YtfE (RIC family)